VSLKIFVTAQLYALGPLRGNDVGPAVATRMPVTGLWKRRKDAMALRVFPAYLLPLEFITPDSSGCLSCNNEVIRAPARYARR
jgi:hypothetical protein